MKASFPEQCRSRIQNDCAPIVLANGFQCCFGGGVHGGLTETKRAFGFSILIRSASTDQGRARPAGSQCPRLRQQVYACASPG